MLNVWGQKRGRSRIKSFLWSTQQNDTKTSHVINLHSYETTHRLQAYTKSKFWTYGGRRDKAPVLSRRSDAHSVMLLYLRPWQVYIPMDRHIDFKHTLIVNSNHVGTEDRNPKLEYSLWRTERNDTINSAVTSLHYYGPTHCLQAHPKSKFWTCVCSKAKALALSYPSDTPRLMIL
jgi:hypothetical protein